MGRPEVHESGGSVAARRPQGRREFIVIRVGRHAAGPPRSQQEWRQFHISQPRGTSRSHSDVRVTSLRWTSQEPTNVTSVPSSQPPGTARPHYVLRVAPLRWTSQEPPKSATVSQRQTPGEATPHSDLRTATVSQFAAPQGQRGLILICVWRHAAGPPRSPRTWRQLRSSQARKDGEASLRSACGTIPRGPQEPTKPATASQFAAPRDGEASF